MITSWSCFQQLGVAWIERFPFILCKSLEFDLPIFVVVLINMALPLLYDTNDVVVHSSWSQMTTRHTFRHLLRHTLSHFVTLGTGSIFLSKWCHFFPDKTSAAISFWWKKSCAGRTHAKAKTAAMLSFPHFGCRANQARRAFSFRTALNGGSLSYTTLLPKVLQLLVVSHASGLFCPAQGLWAGRCGQTGAGCGPALPSSFYYVRTFRATFPCTFILITVKASRSSSSSTLLQLLVAPPRLRS